MKNIVLCKTCGEEKKHQAKGMCEQCYQRQYRAGHKESIARVVGQWRRTNKEMIVVQGKQYRQANKEKIANRKKQHYLDNKESIAIKHKQYNRDNKQSIAAHKHHYYENNREPIALKNKKHYENNKATIIARSNHYYQNNKEACAVRAKQYREDNKAALTTKKKEYYNAHKPWYAALKKQYRQTPHGKRKIMLSNQKRIAMLHQAIHVFTEQEWQAKLAATNGFCPRCEKQVGVDKLTLDHIYPISWAFDVWQETGVKRIYTINDVQPLCGPCNSSKRDKHVVFIPQNEAMKQ